VQDKIGDGAEWERKFHNLSLLHGETSAPGHAAPNRIVVALLGDREQRRPGRDIQHVVRRYRRTADRILQGGGSSLRNNAPQGKNIPIDWVTPSESRGAKNIKWSAALGIAANPKARLASWKRRVYAARRDPQLPVAPARR
jgi:hypothetical protein